MHLDVQYHEMHCKKNDDGFQVPNDPEGFPILSVSRLETLVLYHGAKFEKSRNDVLAAFPPQLIGQLPNLKDLTILSFIDDELSSKHLVESIQNLETLKFKFMNDQPVITCFLEALKEHKNALPLRRLEVVGGRSMNYSFD